MSVQALRVEEQPAPYLVAPALTDHLDTFASAPDGFKRLRELVLNLAVRGRLVPQDANDEPASELVKRMMASKSSNPHKRDMGDTATDSDSATWLRSGWCGVRLGMIGEWGAGATPLRSNPAFFGGGIPWFKSGELSADEISVSEETVTDLALAKCSLRKNRPGDVLIAMYGATIGKASILAVYGTTNQAVCACTPHEGVLNRYLLLLLKALKGNFIAQGAGGAQPNISREKIVATYIGLPPTAEQFRIVAKVEELMALIDRLEAKVSHGETARGKLLDTLLTALADSPDAAATADAWAQLAPHFDLLLQTPADVDRLQQTLLTLAVKGRLVPQDPSDEPAAELLKRILAEKERLIAEGKIKRDKPLPEIEEDEFAYEVPQDWQRVRLADIAVELCTGPFGSALHKQEYVSGGIPLVNPSHLRNGVIQPEIDVSVTRDMSDRLSGYRLSKGDIVLARRGEVGRCAIVTPREEGWLCGTGSFFLKLPTMANRDFLYLLFQSPDTRNYLSEGAVGATMVNLNQRILVMMPIGLPPLAEQSRIVAAVASLTALCDRLRERLAARRDLSAKLATALTESALQ